MSTSSHPVKRSEQLEKEIFKKDITILVLSKIRHKRIKPARLSTFVTLIRNITTPPLKWYIIKSVPSYSNITKNYMLCQQEKFEIFSIAPATVSTKSEEFSK